MISEETHPLSVMLIISDKKKKKKQSMSSGSSLSTSAIEGIIEDLWMKQYRDSTMKNYYCIWKTFNEFFIRLDNKPDKWEDRITLFVAYLIDLLLTRICNALVNKLNDRSHYFHLPKYLIIILDCDVIENSKVFEI